MSKLFVSTSTDHGVTEDFIKKQTSTWSTQHGSDAKMCILCKVEIMTRRTGLNVESVSEYQHEKEVLLGPYTAFLVTGVRRDRLARVRSGQWK